MNKKYNCTVTVLAFWPENKKCICTVTVLAFLWHLCRSPCIPWQIYELCVFASHWECNLYRCVCKAHSRSSNNCGLGRSFAFRKTQDHNDTGSWSVVYRSTSSYFRCKALPYNGVNHRLRIAILVAELAFWWQVLPSIFLPAPRQVGFCFAIFSPS